MQSSANSNSAIEDLANSSPIDEKRGRGWCIFGILLLFDLFGFQLWFHATRTSATIDESPHILAKHQRREAHIPLCGVKITGIGAREQA